MSYIEFDPEKHKTAFADGRLFEIQAGLPNENRQGVSRLVKVTEQAVYEDALASPWFFAVQVGGEIEKQLDRLDLGQPLPTAEALGGWRITADNVRRIEADFDRSLALFEQQEGR